MKKKLRNNILLKILSLLIAFTLWLVVINIDDPVDEKSFSNIRVNFINTNVLTDENRVYEVLDGTGVVRTVRVEAPRKLLESLSESDIVAEADFSKVTVNETIEIRFYSTRSNDEIRSITGSIDMVKLNIEDKKTKRLSLTAETSGTPEEGYILGGITLDQNRIEVSGPESVVSRIVSAGMRVDISESNSDISTYADVILYDSEGNEVDASSLEMNTTSVRVRVQILETREIPLGYTVTGEPAKGYEATGAVDCDPRTVWIAGTPTALAGINRIEIPADVLDITGRERNLTAVVDVRDYLPDNVALAGESDGKVTLTVYIEEIKERELRIPANRVHLAGTLEGYRVELDGNTGEYRVTVRGLEEDLNRIDVSMLNGYIQVQNIVGDAEREIVPGTYPATVNIDFGEGVTLKEPMTVNVNIRKIEE